MNGKDPRSGPERAQTQGPRQLGVNALDATNPHPEHGDAGPGQADMMSVVAHLVSNTVTPLRLHAQTLRGSDLVGPEQEAAAMVQILADRLAHLAADILDLSRMLDGQLRLHYSHFDLQDVARQAVQAVREAAQAKRVWLRLEPMQPCPVHADPSRLQQVVVNLLARAIDSTPAGGRVQVAVRTEGTFAVVQVGDSGAGFHPEDAAQMFGPEGNRRAPRNGLDLHICQGLIEAHGGTIQCQSQGSGLGATFTFSIPLTRLDHA